LGLPGYILVLFVGIILPGLFETGIIHWLKKHRSKSKAQVRRIGQRNPVNFVLS
jgi:uncharacterized iron-regulated membrane protein